MNISRICLCQTLWQVQGTQRSVCKTNSRLHWAFNYRDSKIPNKPKPEQLHQKPWNAQLGVVGARRRASRSRGGSRKGLLSWRENWRGYETQNPCWSCVWVGHSLGMEGEDPKRRCFGICCFHLLFLVVLNSSTVLCYFGFKDTVLSSYTCRTHASLHSPYTLCKILRCTLKCWHASLL